MTRDDDVRAIHGVIADHERAFNGKDADLLAAHFRDESWAVGVTGAELHGPEQMASAARALFSGPLGDQRARYRPGHVEFLGDDVAICHMYATALLEDGSETDVGHAMIALYVFERRDGRWQVVARQNTLVPA